jgi:Tol biopolymer transport system component
MTLLGSPAVTRSGTLRGTQRRGAATLGRMGGVSAIAMLFVVGALPAASGGATSKQANRLIHNGVIVFGRTNPDGITGNLYAISPKGGAPRVLIPGRDLADGIASWSPDGSKFAFDRTVNPTGNSVEKVGVANADGSNVREIVNGGLPVWSPAGSEFAFNSESSSGPSRIYVIRPDGSGKRRLSSLRLDATSPAWSPNGRRLAYSGTGRAGDFVYVVGENGRGGHRLSPVPGGGPAWSPDGKLLAFAGGNSRYTKLFLVSADGRKTRTLLSRPTASLGSIETIGWSRDGKTIAFDGADSQDTHAPYSVYLLASNGRWMKRLRHHAEEPRWSPDGRKLVFLATYRKGNAFEIVTSSGRFLRFIDITTALDTDPAWQPLP